MPGSGEMWHWRSDAEGTRAGYPGMVAAIMLREWRELSEPPDIFAVVSGALARYAFV
jgi:hypothetical protein